VGELCPAWPTGAICSEEWRERERILREKDAELLEALLPVIGDKIWTRKGFRYRLKEGIRLEDEDVAKRLGSKRVRNEKDWVWQR